MANVTIILNIPGMKDKMNVGGDSLTVDVHDDGMLFVDNYINEDGDISQLFLPKGSWTACVAVRDKENDS